MAASRPICVKSVVENLGKYLKQYMPNLNQVIYEFPAPNVQLVYPSISIITGDPEFVPHSNPILLETGTIENNKARIKRIVGSYDFNLQLDLWCRDKFERFSMYEEFFSAFNRVVAPMGLSLQMLDYHGVWCRYDLTGYKTDDMEVSSQRSEWRATIGILANTRAVIETTEAIIETIENNLTMPDNIETINE